MIDNTKKKLIQDAILLYGDKISPCGGIGGGKFDNCFTIHENKLIFWFETTDHSTHIMSSEMNLDGIEHSAN